MLPTLNDPSLVNQLPDTCHGVRRSAPTGVTESAAPCQTCWPFFEDGYDAQRAAAALCEQCPLMDACLRDGLRLDAAYAAGRDPYGVCGVLGGVLFEPGFLPRRPGQEQVPRRHGGQAAA